MSDEKIDIDSLKIILDQVMNTHVKALRTDIEYVRTELKCHTDLQNERDQKIAIATNESIASREYSQMVLRKITDIPEEVHRVAIEFFQPEVKRLDEKADHIRDSLDTHLQDHDKTKKLYQRSLAVAIGTSVVMAIIAALQFFGIKLPGGKP
jgi:glucosamine 6-phosphate synthetase-like amidotransferase/phosphosugar isomerase protein